MRSFLICLLAMTVAQQLCAQEVIDRPGFSLTCPANWKLDKEDPDYDPDHLFTLQSSGSGFVMFSIIYKTLDPDHSLNLQEKQTRKRLMTDSVLVSAFSQWGNLQGKGRILKGKMMKSHPGTVQFFIYVENGRTLLVVSQYLNQHATQTELDINSIANSFAFKN